MAAGLAGAVAAALAAEAGAVVWPNAGAPASSAAAARTVILRMMDILGGREGAGRRRMDGRGISSEADQRCHAEPAFPGLQSDQAAGGFVGRRKPESDMCDPLLCLGSV